MARLITGLYYHHLNQDPDFLQDLSALFARLEELGIPLSSTQEGRRLWERAQALEGEPGSRPPAPTGAYYERAVGLAREVGGFLARWPLPQRIWDDLRRSYDFHLRLGKARGRPPRLELAGHAEWQPRPGLPVVVEERREADGTLIRVVDRQPWIFPSHPLPFLYDPLRHDRAWLEAQIKAICREVRESILEQARAYEEEVEAQGWKEPGPWRRRRGQLELLAYLLYLRAVKRNTWQELGELAIKAGLYREDSDAPGTVRKRVTAFARLIGLPL